MPARRQFLAALLAATAAPRLGWAAAGSPAFLAAARRPDGSFALSGLAADGAERFRLALPARAHAGAAHPARAEAVVFARRPGTYALVLDCAEGTVVRQLAPPEGLQFNGHGAFDRAGRLLFTSEQEAATSAGRIGVWDAADGYARLGTLDSGGIGPHEIRLMPDGAALVVANGGIATDPADRSKLNLPQMRPNLTLLALDGEVLDRCELAGHLHQSSIRHLALGAGIIAFAMQWEGPPDALTPLLGLWRPGADPVLASAPEAEQRAMKGYAGSVALSGDGAEVAITSPVGGRLHRFDLAGGFLGTVARPDVCGLAPCGTGFLASDGAGGLIAVEAGVARPLTRHPAAWDNHIVVL